MRSSLLAFAALFTLVAPLAACSAGSAEDSSDDGAAVVGSDDGLARYGMATGTLVTGEAATTLRTKLLAKGGKRPWTNDSGVVAGFVAHELTGFASDDTRTFGVSCQAKGTYGGDGPLFDDTCFLTAVVDMSVQKMPLLKKSIEDAAYDAKLTGKLAAEIATALPDASFVRCSEGTCTVNVKKGSLGSFEPALSGPLRQMKEPEIAKMVGAFFK